MLFVSEKCFTFVKSNRKWRFCPIFNKFSSMKDRIRQIMESQHMTQQTFANFIGMSAASLSNIFNDRTKPTVKTVEAIKSKIPNLSTDWILFGSGSMYNDDKNASSPTLDTKPANSAEPTLDFSDDMPSGVAHVAPEPQPSSYVPRQQPAQIVKPEIRYAERPRRQITEIRIFFDDGTFETFAPKK